MKNEGYANKLIIIILPLYCCVDIFILIVEYLDSRPLPGRLFTDCELKQTIVLKNLSHPFVITFNSGKAVFGILLLGILAKKRYRSSATHCRCVFRSGGKRGDVWLQNPTNVWRAPVLTYSKCAEAHLQQHRMEGTGG